jgi:hypothetical protein
MPDPAPIKFTTLGLFEFVVVLDVDGNVELVVELTEEVAMVCPDL